jgi:hypothetical protein
MSVEYYHGMKNLFIEAGIITSSLLLSVTIGLIGVCHSFKDRIYE